MGPLSPASQLQVQLACSSGGEGQGGLMKMSEIRWERGRSGK